MANDSVYVAIAIACVVALLVLAILVIYCIKRQQDKMNERIVRERRLREERQRRNFMRAQIVQPPSYEASRGRQAGFPINREIPYSPPPEYKEVATPIPGLRHNQVVGIGGMQDPFNGYPPEYREISSVSRNVAPAYTHMPPGTYTAPNNSVYSNNIINNSRNSQNNLSAQRNDNAIQVQVSPRSTRALPDVVTSITSARDRTPAQSAEHPSNSRPAQNHDRQRSLGTASRMNPTPQGPGSAQQTQGGGVSGAYVGNHVNTPPRSSANIHTAPARNLEAGPGTNTTTSTQGNPVPTQFQDLSFI